MKKFMLLFAVITTTVVAAQAQLYSTGTGKTDFYSKTPVEDIEAHSKQTMAVLNTEKKAVAFKVTNTTFEFTNKLMEEHFNEKYMESEKFPTSTFSGTINETIDFEKDGVYKVTVTGKLNIHGVELPRTISGTITVAKGQIQLVSDFKVKVADHKIEVPTMVMAKIAEEIDVHVDATLNLKK